MVDLVMMDLLRMKKLLMSTKWSRKVLLKEDDAKLKNEECDPQEEITTDIEPTGFLNSLLTSLNYPGKNLD